MGDFDLYLFLGSLSRKLLVRGKGFKNWLAQLAEQELPFYVGVAIRKQIVAG